MEVDKLITEIVARLERIERYLAPYMTEEDARPIPKLLPPDMCDTMIDQLEISVRLANCLINDRHETVGAVLALHEVELLRVPNFGKVCLRELIEALEALAAKYNAELPPGWCREFRAKMKRRPTYAMSQNDPRLSLEA